MSALERQLTKLAPVSNAQTELRARQQVVTTALTDDVDFQRLIQQVTAQSKTGAPWAPRACA